MWDFGIVFRERAKKVRRKRVIYEFEVFEFTAPDPEDEKGKFKKRL